MPRTARVKSADSIFHIMVRSVGDTPLFRCDIDKDKYLYFLKKYQDTYVFKVYAYCLMDTHAHIIIDASGADISKIMHAINQCYAQYFNKKYKRHGHLFADRFKSRIIYDDRYLVTLSGYIHNNPTDIEEFSNKIELYTYSSLGIYLGIRNDNLSLVDYAFVLQQFSIYNKTAGLSYINFVKTCNNEKLKSKIEFQEEKTEYRSERHVIVRNFTPLQVIEYVAAYTGQNSSNINVTHIKGVTEFKSLSALVLRCLCDMNQKDICKLFGNISQSHSSRLCREGFNLIYQNSKYKNLIKDFLSKAAS